MGKKQKRKFKPKRAVIFILICIFLFYVGNSGLQIYKLRKEEKSKQAELRKLEEEKKRLNEELKRIDDPEYVEEAARRFLKMIKEGETLYLQPNDEKLNEK